MACLTSSLMRRWSRSRRSRFAQQPPLPPLPQPRPIFISGGLDENGRFVRGNTQYSSLSLSMPTTITCSKATQRREAEGGWPGGRSCAPSLPPPPSFVPHTHFSTLFPTRAEKESVLESYETNAPSSFYPVCSPEKKRERNNPLVPPASLRLHPHPSLESTE